MKLALVMSFLAANTLFAADANPKFAEEKTRMLGHLDGQIKILENVKSCVTAAADMDSVKKCHEDAKTQRKALEGEKIDNQIKRLEEKKKALEEKKK